jgi:hypothetical protein
MLARNRQEMIANELSRLACDEYLEDVMQHMRHMEVRSFTSRLLRSPLTPRRTRRCPTLTSSTCSARSSGS